MDHRLIELESLRSHKSSKHRQINIIQSQIKEIRTEMNRICVEYAKDNNYCIIELGLPHKEYKLEYPEEQIVYMDSWYCRAHECSHNMCPTLDKKYLTKFGEECNKSRYPLKKRET